VSASRRASPAQITRARPVRPRSRCDVARRGTTTRVRDELTCTVSRLGDLAGHWLEATGTASDWVVCPLHVSKTPRRFVDVQEHPVLRLRRRIGHGGVTASLTTSARSCSEPRGRYGVVALIVAEEFQYVWSARNRARKPGLGVHRVRPQAPASGRLLLHHFNTHDPKFGLGFIKCGSGRRGRVTADERGVSRDRAARRECSSDEIGCSRLTAVFTGLGQSARRPRSTTPTARSFMNASASIGTDDGRFGRRGRVRCRYCCCREQAAWSIRKL